MFTEQEVFAKIGVQAMIIDRLQATLQQLQEAAEEKQDEPSDS